MVMFFQTKVGKRNLQQQTGNLAQVQLMVFIICFHFRSNTIKAIHEICTYMYINLRKKFEKWAWKKKTTDSIQPIAFDFFYLLPLPLLKHLPTINESMWLRAGTSSCETSAPGGLKKSGQKLCCQKLGKSRQTGLRVAWGKAYLLGTDAYPLF